MRLLRCESVTAKTGLERSAIYQRMQRGEFPKQVRLGPKSVGWLESEIDAWIAERVRQRDERCGRKSQVDLVREA
jgi:prophage regulatory protein